MDGQGDFGERTGHLLIAAEGDQWIDKLRCCARQKLLGKILKKFFIAVFCTDERSNWTSRQFYRHVEDGITAESEHLQFIEGEPRYR